ncbi:peroxisomal nicotinamide adenine dinucleotide carrier-like [Magnolia sinica]|uniref:peroxisomal nicotinamide adenine dinucleotide carrier-like n=1 Tax=Magnolia sinica TaxID=86752 RepID=UPI00265B4B20|nr:peroxisomal nicotinamide adenine dinucleotide carrier-like [Magnolia sinica]
MLGTVLGRVRVAVRLRPWNAELVADADFTDCVELQLEVSNPSIQFMLYETMLKQLKERRTLSKKATKGVTVLEVFLLGAVAKLRADCCDLSPACCEGN